MESRKLTPSIRKYIFFLLGCLVGIYFGWVMIQDDKLMGWACILFCGICGVAFILQMVPGASWLYLDNEGFTVRVLFRVSRHLWADIHELGVVKIRSNEMVAYNFVSDFDRGKVGRSFSRKLSGFEGALPDTFGFKAKDLLHLMKKYKHNNANAADNKTAAD
jgi:hypothetical protein